MNFVYILLPVILIFFLGIVYFNYSTCEKSEDDFLKCCEKEKPITTYSIALLEYDDNCGFAHEEFERFRKQFEENGNKVDWYYFNEKNKEDYLMEIDQAPNHYNAVLYWDETAKCVIMKLKYETKEGESNEQ